MLSVSAVEHIGPVGDHVCIGQRGHPSQVLSQDRLNRQGTIAPSECALLERYLRVGNFLNLIHAKARCAWPSQLPLPPEAMNEALNNQRSRTRRVARATDPSRAFSRCGTAATVIAASCYGRVCWSVEKTPLFIAASGLETDLAETRHRIRATQPRSGGAPAPGGPRKESSGPGGSRRGDRATGGPG